MPSEEVPRRELIRLLQGEEEEPEGWRITNSALAEGRRLIPSYLGHLGAYALQLYILNRLRDNLAAWHTVELGSGEPGYALTNADGKGLYIKLTIQDSMVVILSFHVSKHV